MTQWDPPFCVRGPGGGLDFGADHQVDHLNHGQQSGGAEQLRTHLSAAHGRFWTPGSVCEFAIRIKLSRLDSTPFKTFRSSPPPRAM
jgi:hypothetical protein